MKIYIESEACLVKRCNAARGSPSAPPSVGTGPTVLTAARASPFRGFSNSTYTKSPKLQTNGQNAISERLNSKSSRFSPHRSSSRQPRPAEEPHITQIRGPALIINESYKASVGKEARKGMLTGSAARSAREAVTMAREASGAPHVTTTLAAPAGFVWASTTATGGETGESQCYVAARRG